MVSEVVKDQRFVEAGKMSTWVSERDDKGRYLCGKGNGRPYTKRIAKIRKTIWKQTRLTDVKAIDTKLLSMALAGDIQAMRLWLELRGINSKTVRDDPAPLITFNVVAMLKRPDALELVNQLGKMIASEPPIEAEVIQTPNTDANPLPEQQVTAQSNE